MGRNRIVNRGDGPKIEGTRITVYDVLEYLNKGRSGEWIAVTLGLSSRQVQTAIEYIHRHEAEVHAAYGQIMERVRQGNPAWVEERLRQNRPRFEAMLASCESRAGSASEARQHAENAGRR